MLAEVYAAVRGWRAVALGADVGLPASQLEDFAPAFEHREMEAAKAIVR